MEMDMDMNMSADFDTFTNGYEDSTQIMSKPKPIRKKFAVPPIKVACLECRASRTRCDGKEECSNCTNKGKTCVYTQSRRGGSRIRKKKVASDKELTPPANNHDLNHVALSILPELDQASFTGPLSFVAPGGGLKQLDLVTEDTDFSKYSIFDEIFPAQETRQDSGYATSDHAGTSPSIDEHHAPIRVYTCDEDILSAYYVYIHPYFPTLPAPSLHQVTDNPDVGIRRSSDAIYTSTSVPDFEPSSPLSLAISATLALIPHPDDPDPLSLGSIRLRREQAQAFAQSAFESIEVESELLESSIQPGDALSTEPNVPNRIPFHPQNPIENESIIALLLLSTYEYAQRGNIAKMRNRAGQALNAAMDLGLHAKGDEDGFFAEANRRVWWMTYIGTCQGAILSNSSPPMLLYDPRFTTASPSFDADPGSWDLFLQSQRIITSATQFVIDLDAQLKLKSTASDMWDRMLELDALIEPLVMAADNWSSPALPPTALDRSELCVAQALRGIARIKLNSARIKLHRYCAFSDVPIFTKKHCDLKSAKDSDTPMAPQCGCSTTFHQISNLETLPLSLISGPTIPPLSCGILPFSSHFSAKVCFKSAFSIANAFQNLPIPQPIRATDPMSFFPPMIQDTKSPRMVPIFACCAMQSSYALIMLSYKTKAMGFLALADENRTSAQAKMLVQLHEGLQIILAALTNYSIAYEALGGMRDQIEVAAQTVHAMKVDTLQEGHCS